MLEGFLHLHIVDDSTALALPHGLAAENGRGDADDADDTIDTIDTIDTEDFCRGLLVWA